MNRLRTLKISAELLFELFTAGEHSAGYRVVAQAIPADAELVNVRHAWPNGVELIIRSESFDPIDPGAEPPPLVPRIEKAAA